MAGKNKRGVAAVADLAGVKPDDRSVPKLPHPASPGSPALPPIPRRALALDALRGLSILGMIFSGVIEPLRPELPLWMYHAQVRPHQKFDENLAGLTWVDLVFPFFLFCLGAALPIALGGRVARGESKLSLAAGGLRRAALLLGFSLVVAHLNPVGLAYSTKNPAAFWLLGLAAYGALFAALGRWPARWPAAARAGLSAAGWGALALFAIVAAPALGAPTASLQRTDIIIVLLADAVAVGTAAWLLTRGRALPKFALLGVGLAMHLARNAPGRNWLEDFTDMRPLEALVGKPAMEYVMWAFHPRYLKYLFVVIPGMMAGEWLAEWLKAPPTPAHAAGKLPAGRGGAVVLLWAAALVLTLGGLQSRQVTGTLAADAVLWALGLAAVAGAGVASARASAAAGTGGAVCATGLLIRRLWTAGGAWLLIGILLDPYQDGIKKDNATLSYYAVTVGLAHLTLAAFTVIADVWNRPRALGLLSANGQNPMIGYVTQGFLVAPLLALTGLGGLMAGWAKAGAESSGNPWPGAIPGALATLLSALVVAWFTKRRVFWRT